MASLRIPRLINGYRKGIMRKRIKALATIIKN